MEDSQGIFDELIGLRDALRKEHTVNGREPKICSDESLSDMAERLPAKKNDLLMIKGIGETFVEKYGESFLMITRKHIRTAAKSVPLDGASEIALKDLQKKLTNISKGNPLLYCPKMVKSRMCDLTSFGMDDPMEIINDKEILLCGIDDRARYEGLNLISRETLRDFREKGSTDLYMAYPFICGPITDDFPVMAPLILFPVRLRKHDRRFYLSYDHTRDAVFNNTLVLANMRFNNIRKDLQDCVIDDPSHALDGMDDFYKDNGITYINEHDDTHPFSYHEESSLKVEHTLILGKFPLYSNSIQRDFDALASKGSINRILDRLISPPEKEPIDLTESGPDVNEKDITYINQINSAQEKVIEVLTTNDELVVQGPPGTGKSQVITGMITTAINEGKTVLMVSEKKTALDVVHSRLGDLSKYVMMIDDVSDKDLFYEQLSMMLDLPPNENVSPAEIDPISDKIERHLSELTRIADGMYRPDSFGIEPYRMYSLVKKVDLNDPDEFRRYLMLKDNISSSLLNIGYSELHEAYERFCEKRTISDMRSYYQCLDSNPWMAYVRRDLTDFELRSLGTDLRELSKASNEYDSMGFSDRLFGKGHVTRMATTILNRYFTNYNAKHIDQLLNDTKRTLESLESYPDYVEKLSSYERLPRIQRMYGENIISVNTRMPSSYEMSNDELFAFIMMDHLKSFERENADLLKDIDDFDMIRDEVDADISGKRKATKDRVEFILRDSLKAVTDSKMISEMRRITESKRRWSVNKFISKFGSDLFRGIKVWLLTPETVSELLPLDMGLFDLLIFDEASQIYVEKGIPSIYRAKKVVIAGDHRQLRPSSLGSGRICFDEDGISDEDSLLDLARSRYDSIMLNFHYRSKYEELIAFSNYAFYGGRLYVSPNVDVPELPPIETHLVDGARWENKCNRKEAIETVSLLKRILSERENDETIGIITFNTSQRDLIYDLIEKESIDDPEFGNVIRKEASRKENGEDIGLFLKNIESVQGDERDIIIFSIGYAKNESGKISKMFGWLNNIGGENRLNVAISRARRKIHIITSFRPDELDVSDSKNEGPRLLKRYLEYAFAVSSKNRDEEEQILNSLSERTDIVVDRTAIFNDQICESLKRRGYDAETNFGIGGYSIDVVVKDGDQYVLGIECDNSLYSGATSTRERDYHRQKYLESRGWSIRRVWSNKWWNDPEKETDAIVSILESDGHHPSRIPTVQTL